ISISVSTALSSFSYTPSSTPVFYTLSLHDALPISSVPIAQRIPLWRWAAVAASIVLVAAISWYAWPGSGSGTRNPDPGQAYQERSEEHTSELQSLRHLVCRLLLEKKKISNITY